MSQCHTCIFSTNNIPLWTWTAYTKIWNSRFINSFHQTFTIQAMSCMNSSNSPFLPPFFWIPFGVFIPMVNHHTFIGIPRMIPPNHLDPIRKGSIHHSFEIIGVLGTSVICGRSRILTRRSVILISQIQHLATLQRWRSKLAFSNPKCEFKQPT